MTITREGDWLTDGAGNEASITYFGSEAAAREALESLEDCRDCINCTRCTRCSRCNNCTDCSRCSRCVGCTGCSRCTRCTGCTDCSNCSGCLGCTSCSNVAQLHDKDGLRGDPSITSEPGAPEIPRIENIHQTVFAAVSQPNALDMRNWHTCETTHCRAGWVTTLAGEAGKRLEEFHNPELAAMLIYRESGYQINPGRFHDDNEAAMADMRRLAEAEAASPPPAAGTMEGGL